VLKALLFPFLVNIFSSPFFFFLNTKIWQQQHLEEIHVIAEPENKSSKFQEQFLSHS